jgi:curli biogenesis system outer membrane secretion channel CsgG
MVSSKIVTVMAIGLAFGLSACASVTASRQEAEVKQKEVTHRMDMAHIWVTTEAPPAGKPFTELGQLTYTEPFTPDAIEEAQIKERLKKMAFEKWPDTIDAVVDENQTISADGAQVTVTGKAIQYESSVDRAMMHKMNEGMVASPSGN